MGIINNLHKNDVVIVQFPDLPGVDTITKNHMSMILHMNDKDALVIPISSLFKNGKQKKLSETDIIITKGKHPFLQHDSFLKGHKIVSVPLSWIKQEREAYKVVGKIHPEVDKKLTKVILSTLKLWGFVHSLASDMAEKKQQENKTHKTLKK